MIMFNIIVVFCFNVWHSFCIILDKNIKKKYYMNNLNFIRNCSNEDLKILVDYITKDEKGKTRYTECLTSKECYKRNYPDNIAAFSDEIINELSRFGGNTLMNIIRGEGVSYKQLLCDVCDKMKVNYNKKSSVEVIENNFLQTILINSLEDMSHDDMKALIDSMEIRTMGFGKQAMVVAIQAAILNGGFTPYKMAVIVANAVAKSLLGRGLALAANAALVKAMNIFAGPIGFAASVLWTVVDIAGPAYRVTIPAVAQICYMRRFSQKLLTDKCNTYEN